jgi:diacylglycerol kinase family enzyme
LILVTAGGDGTPMRVAKQYKESGIDLNTIQFCFLPFGTGNDISRVSGWGGLPELPFYRGDALKSLIEEVV